HFCVGKGGRKLFAAIHLGDKFNFLWRQARFHTRQGKAVLLDHGLEVAAVGDEVNVKSLTGCRMVLDAFSDLNHAAGLREIECARSEKNCFLRHRLAPRFRFETADLSYASLPGKSLL